MLFFQKSVYAKYCLRVKWQRLGNSLSQLGLPGMNKGIPITRELKLRNYYIVKWRLWNAEAVLSLSKKMDCRISLPKSVLPKVCLHKHQWETCRYEQMTQVRGGRSTQIYWLDPSIPNWSAYRQEDGARHDNNNLPWLETSCPSNNYVIVTVS